VTGVANGWVGGTTPICREFVLELLRCMVELQLQKARYAVMNFPRRWSERNDVAKVFQARSTRLLQNEAPFFPAAGHARFREVFAAMLRFVGRDGFCKCRLSAG
jgi:hypothetical protein